MGGLEIEIKIEIENSRGLQSLVLCKMLCVFFFFLVRV